MRAGTDARTTTAFVLNHGDAFVRIIVGIEDLTCGCAELFGRAKKILGHDKAVRHRHTSAKSATVIGDAIATPIAALRPSRSVAYNPAR